MLIQTLTIIMLNLCLGIFTLILILCQKKKEMKLEEIALKYQDLITGYYSTLAKEAFNIKEHRFEMKTECIIRSGYFRATRSYAQWITKKEGVPKDDLDIKGIRVYES
jgi:uncharacterized protein YkuJ